MKVVDYKILIILYKILIILIILEKVPSTKKFVEEFVKANLCTSPKITSGAPQIPYHRRRGLRRSCWDAQHLPHDWGVAERCQKPHVFFWVKTCIFCCWTQGKFELLRWCRLRLIVIRLCPKIWILCPKKYTCQCPGYSSCILIMAKINFFRSSPVYVNTVCCWQLGKDSNFNWLVVLTSLKNMKVRLDHHPNYYGK